MSSILCHCSNHIRKDFHNTYCGNFFKLVSYSGGGKYPIKDYTFHKMKFKHYKYILKKELDFNTLLEKEKQYRETMLNDDLTNPS